MIKDIETLENIFTLVKNVKKPWVKIYPDGRVIGTDEQFASLNTIITDNINYNIDIPYIFKLSEITAFMRVITDRYQILYDKFYIEDYISHTILDNHLELNFDFDRLYGTVASLDSNKILYKEENFQLSNPEMLSLKSDSGAVIYKVDNRYLMSSFNAIHPANKTDRVDLIIKEYDVYSFVGEFIIYKKKDNYQIHEFLRFRYI